ncbi:hypothetical protein EZJ50_08960 [Listeria monocytogenes]|nr:hypothetical protein [Listeria monocytogenes]ELR5863710.1 hypothetical protein [Listeria monocytogenes]
MCEFCTSDNTKLELECVGDYAHVKLESCINFLGDSVHCLAVDPNLENEIRDAWKASKVKEEEE